MKKELTETGTYGTFTGTIKITFDYKSAPIVGYNPSTHDEFIKQTSYHKIEVFVGDKIDVTKGTLLTKEEVFKEIGILEKDLKRKLKSLANDPPIKTIEEQLKEQEFN